MTTNSFYFLSPRARDEVIALINNLSAPGGVVSVYDSEAQSVVVIGVDKRGVDTRYIGWSIFGPVSPEEADEAIAASQASVGGLEPVSH